MIGHGRPTSIGLDCSGRAMRAVQVHLRRGVPVVDAVAIMPRENPEAAVDADEVNQFRAILDRRGFKGERLVMHVPDEHLLTSVIDFQTDCEQAAIEESVLEEFNRLGGCEPHEMELVWWSLPEQPRAQRLQVMAAACPHNDAIKVMQPFRDVDIEVEALDLEAAAMAVATAPMMTVKEGLYAVVSLDWASTLVCVYLGGELLYRRTIHDTGLRRFHDTLCEQHAFDIQSFDLLMQHMQVNDAGRVELTNDAFPAIVTRSADDHLQLAANEIQRSLSYICQQYTDAELRQVFLCGEGSTIAGIGAALSIDDQRRARVLPLSTLATLGPHIESGSDRPDLTLALGLAQHRH